MHEVIAKEKEKYDRIWAKASGSYGASSPERIFLTERVPAERVERHKKWLVVGAGDGQGFRILVGRGRNVYACDLAGGLVGRYPDGRFEMCPAHELPYDTESFDAVLCIDVIEHIPMAFVPPSLREMQRVVVPGGSLFLQARCAASVFEPDLHQTVRSHEWWYGRFRMLGHVEWVCDTGLDMAAEVKKT